MELTADKAPAWFARYTQCLKSGDVAGAEAVTREVLARNPKDVFANACLGAALLALRRYGEAETVFDALIQEQPEEVSHWMNLGLAHRGLQAYDQALGAFSRAMRIDPEEPILHFNLGITHLERGDLESAHAVLERARQLSPLEADVRLQYAIACYRSLRNDEALRALLDWESLQNASAETTAQIGQLLVNLGSQAEGLRALQAALAKPDCTSQTRLTALEVFERINRTADARALLMQLESSADATSLSQELRIARARLLQREGRDAEALPLYESALAAASGVEATVPLRFQVAQVQSALGQYETCWQTLLAAHKDQQEYLQSVAPALVLRGAPRFAITEQGCNAEDVRSWSDAAPSLEDSPIFVVAFPRSGTTLLELTLDAHPLLQSMDEQPFVQDALDDMRKLGVDYPRALAPLTAEQLDGLRAGYWRRVASKVELRADARLVDKNPLNILRLPVIRRLFPNSPVILAVRHPCDVVLSCYMQHFRAPDFAQVCNRLDTLAGAWTRSMDFWCREMPLLGGPQLVVQYETLVQDFAGEVRKVADFLQLPWNERMLRPADNALAKGYISTPSYAQVVRPVSSAAVGRWQNFASQLRPILPLIRAQMERWGYSATDVPPGVSPNSK